MEKDLDLITIGRSSVDLYGAQVGGRLEDMRSFEKYIGGSPTNIAAGSSRLGLRSALITRVGDEHMGRFIREELEREGVDTTCVITDSKRLTALVLLGIRDSERFPLIFYRSDCADMALCEEDINPEFIARARCVTATGTHLSHPRTEGAVIKALEIARATGAQTALDIDYRPNLWGLSGHGDGENRYIESAQVTERLQSTLHLFDLVVGTEEEFHIAGGSKDTIKALRSVRDATAAVLICKRGPMGAGAFTGAIPDSLDQGESGPGFPVEVFNVLGAGDGFMSGLLKGWLTGQDWRTALTYANACGALAVSRHGCTPSYPSWKELRFFLRRGVKVRELRKDLELEHVHRATNYGRNWPTLRVFAFDHQDEQGHSKGIDPERIGTFKNMCLEAALRVAGGRQGYGIFSDGHLGREALYRAAGTGLWIGRSPADLPAEALGHRTTGFEVDCGNLGEWPQEHVVRSRWHLEVDGDAVIWGASGRQIERVFAAARRNRLEFMLELDGSATGTLNARNMIGAVQRCQEAGIRPDWWLLNPPVNWKSWSTVCDTIEGSDPYVRGIVVSVDEVLSGDSMEEISEAAGHGLVRGFAAGKQVFSNTIRAWSTDELDDEDAILEMVRTFGNLCCGWDRVRNPSYERPHHRPATSRVDSD